MTPEQQNIAIAKAVGWRYLDNRTGYPRGIFNGVTLEIPSYTADLNAMHEAEKVLTTEDQQKEYARQLHFNEGGKHFLLRDFEALHATAAQRSEAFLRTLGLWEDGK